MIQRCHLPLRHHYPFRPRIAIPGSSALIRISPISLSSFFVVTILVNNKANGVCLVQRDHPGYTGSEDDPENGPAVAASIFTAVIVYAVCWLALLGDLFETSSIANHVFCYGYRHFSSFVLSRPTFISERIEVARYLSRGVKRIRTYQTISIADLMKLAFLPCFPRFHPCTGFWFGRCTRP